MIVASTSACSETSSEVSPTCLSAPYVQTGQAAPEAPPAARAVHPVRAAPPSAPPPETLARLMTQLRGMAHSAEDVGERLPEEARRIHYGETEARDIRGSASADEVESLLEEGILVLPVPPAEEDLH